MADPNVKFYKGEIVGVTVCSGCRNVITSMGSEQSTLSYAPLDYAGPRYDTLWISCTNLEHLAFLQEVGLSFPMDVPHWQINLVKLEDPFDTWVRDVREEYSVDTDVAR